MSEMRIPRIALVYPGDYEARQAATTENNRFADLFHALKNLGVTAEPAVYHPEFWQEVRAQLMHVDAALVWVNPIQDGHDRTVLDAMLREVADAGIFVSAHPDVILKMGTKEVLYQTRDLGWGCDTHIYHNLEQLKQALPAQLASGEARVLKQYRGNGGSGVWKVQLDDLSTAIHPETLIRVRHAERGSVEQVMPLSALFTLCEPYFAGSGKMIDQQYQTRLPEGMIRCYLVQNRVAGFGHQAINALYPAPSGSDPSVAPQPGPRLYHPPTTADWQSLKRQLETDWVPAMQDILDIQTDDLPIIWDADFLLGENDANGDDTYVLCEINVSSVAPYPESAVPFMAEAAVRHAQLVRDRRA